MNKPEEDEGQYDEEEFFTESNKFKQMMFENLNGIVSKFNLRYPINPKLAYDYPPLNPIICQNIVNSLYKCPKFYTQTLHLMNKMNLPCPLVDFVREPWLNIPIHPLGNVPPPVELNPNDQPQRTATADDDDDDESEIGSDTDTKQLEEQLNNKPPIESHFKKVKLKSLIKSTSSSSDQNQTSDKPKIDDIFEQPSKVNFKISKKLTQQ